MLSLINLDSNKETSETLIKFKNLIQGNSIKYNSQYDLFNNFQEKIF
jgi:hypothetical protein